MPYCSGYDNGEVEWRNGSYLMIVENFGRTDPGESGGELLTECIYDTVENAKEVWNVTVENMWMGWLDIVDPQEFNIIDPQDPRFKGDGNCFDNIIRYKNVVCRIECQGLYNSTTQKLFASLWLDKVSKTKPPLTVDVAVSYKLDDPNVKRTNELEAAADQHYIDFFVMNNGSESVKDVWIQYYTCYPNEAEYKALGEPVSIGEIEPGKEKEVGYTWDLKGENVENVSFGVYVYVPDAVDTNLDNNFAVMLISIYFAHNGERAYSYHKDTYKFENYETTDEDIEGVAEELIAVVRGFTDAEGAVTPSMVDMWSRMGFAATYDHLYNYFNASYKLKEGGHCYGMAATSSLYFFDSSLKPCNKETYDMTK
jgi:hypothetical protein